MIHRFAALGSTNDECLRLAAGGAPSGTAVVADRQSAGRGRHGRAWSSPPGTGLYVSLLVRLAPDFGRPPSMLPLVAGLAAARAVASLLRAAGHAGPYPALKWPNDVLLGGRKLAGILVEGSFSPDGAFAAVVGLGVNVSTDPRDLPPRALYPATSILAATGLRIDREELLRAWLAEMDAALAAWRRPDGDARVAGEWNALDAHAGRTVRIARAADEPGGGVVVEGVDEGVVPGGALRLRCPDGGHRDVLVGDCAP